MARVEHRAAHQPQAKAKAKPEPKAQVKASQGRARGAGKGQGLWQHVTPPRSVSFTGTTTLCSRFLPVVLLIVPTDSTPSPAVAPLLSRKPTATPESYSCPHSREPSVLRPSGRALEQFCLCTSTKFEHHDTIPRQLFCSKQVAQQKKKQKL